MLDLTPLDRRICDLLLQALSNREISVRLGMTENAVKHYLGGIFRRNEIDPRKDRRVLLAVLYYGEKSAALGWS
jgi:DNA-binding CsgD family transcriptional regulator